MATNKKTDFFVSYNSEDLATIEQFVRHLQQLHIDVWFDQDQLRPGNSWLTELHKNLMASESVGIFIGCHGIGPWQKPEIAAAFEKYVAGNGNVIPIILPDVKEYELPEFLNQTQVIDCRRDSLGHTSVHKVYWGITGSLPTIQKNLIGEVFELEIERQHNTNNVINIFTLPNRSKSKLLQLSWLEFGVGIDSIVQQIKDNGTRVLADACIGINDAGLVMATFVNSACFERGKIGSIITEKKGTRTVISENCLLPQLEKEPTIVLFDFEVKRSRVLALVIGYLRTKYDNPHFVFAVFGAMTENESLVLENISQLVSYDEIKAVDISDIFIAATMHSPGIEPPHDLR